MKGAVPMNKDTLLYIECSPRKKRSVSKKIAEIFLQAYKTKHPKCLIRKIDIWDFELPEYDETTVDAKFKIMSGSEFSTEEKSRWKAVEAVFADFHNAGKYLFSIPMWNFSIPYKLKHYIDVITQPGMAFRTTPGGYEGLLTGRKAAVIYSSGGRYDFAPLDTYDMQTAYMELWLKFIGIKSVSSIHVAPLTWSPAEKDEAIDNATREAASLAEKF
jgi:FMN-dependent NADH-azoreductase